MIFVVLLKCLQKTTIKKKGYIFWL